MNIKLPILLAILSTMVMPAMERVKTELHKAAANCNRSTDVHSMIDRSTAEINIQDGDGNTPLHEAAYYGCKENAYLLLQYGADVNKQNYQGETPLDKAHYNNHQNLETLLKEYGGHYSRYKNLNRSLSQKELDTLLWNASISRNYNKILSALKRGANPNAMHDDGAGVKMTPLHRIARSADYTTPYTVMQILLDYGANINQEDSAGWTPYGRASQGADSQTGDYIGKFFRERNARFKKGW